MTDSNAQKGEFRKYLPDLTTKRFTVMRGNDAYGHAGDFKELHNPPWLYGLYELWMKLLEEPFKGVTNDGMDCFPSIWPDEASTKSWYMILPRSCER